MKKAIIVPGITDSNKGDQALVWESHRLINDTKRFDNIYIISSGDSKEERKKLCSQSEEKGFKFIENILKHPRRGKHKKQEAIKESLFNFLKLSIVAAYDFLSKSFLLLICNNQRVVKLFYNKNINNTIKHFKESDTVFVKGGGFIHAYGEKTAPYLIWFFLFYVKLAKAMNKKVVFLPNSYGPFEGFTVKKQIINVFSKIDLIYAREELSAHKLGKLLNKKIKVRPDLGFYLKTNKTKQNSILIKYGFNKIDKIVGVTIRPWRFPGKNNPTELFENYINSIVVLANHITNLGYKVALCNQSIGPNSHEDDRNAITELLKRTSNENIIWINEDLPSDKLKDLYSNFYIFIGTRFHSVIFSMTSLIPSIAIGYGGNKAKGIMNDFDLEKYSVLIEDVTSEKLIYLFNQVEKNHSNIKNILQKKLKLINEKREILIKEIIEII